MIIFQLKKGHILKQDSILGVYLIEFADSIKTDDIIQFNFFKIDHKKRIYDQAKSIVENGSYLTHRDFEPILGYNPQFEIKSNSLRKKYNLEPLKEESQFDDHLEKNIQEMEKMSFETILSTTENQ